MSNAFYKQNHTIFYVSTACRFNDFKTLANSLIKFNPRKV